MNGITMGDVFAFAALIGAIWWLVRFLPANEHCNKNCNQGRTCDCSKRMPKNER